MPRVPLTFFLHGILQNVMLEFEKHRFAFYMQRIGAISRFLDVGLGKKDLADFNIGVQVIGNHIGKFNLMYSVFNL